MNAIKPKPAVNAHSDHSRLWCSLNEDCLIHLCKFLSFWDIINIAQSSPQLAAFADANVFPKRARNCLLFANYPHRDRSAWQLISLSAFSEAMQFLGPHLTHLSLSGRVFDMSHDDTSAEDFVHAIFDNCPRLKSLRLESVPLRRAPRDRPLPDGGRHPQLQQLGMTDCRYLDDDWCTFIGQLSGLQSLVLHQCLSQNRQPDALQFITCNALRVLSVINYSNGDVADNMGVIAASRETLRVLDFDFNATALNASFSETMLPPLMRHLETVVVFPSSEKLAPVEELRHLRKIILRNFEKFSEVPRWLVQLAASPHCVVEHIVLMQALDADAMWETVRLFSVELRVLEVNRHWSVNRLCNMPRLQTLRISHCRLHLEPVLLAAIRGCRELRHVVVTNTIDVGDLSVALLVQALRESANEAGGGGNGNRRLRLHFIGCNLDGCDELRIIKDDVLLHTNADILELVVSPLQTFRNGVGFMSFEEYMIWPYSRYDGL